MKREGHLLERIIELNNLLDAFHKAQRGKMERKVVREFRANLPAELLSIQRALLSRTFVFGNYQEFMISDPKRRLIQAAPFRQRVVHHAIINIIGPILERRFIFDSYSCRKGKGQHAALNRATSFCRKHPYYLKMDIRKFYDSIDHNVLKRMLIREVKDCHLLDMLGNLIDSYCVGPGRGLPIGNLTSQYFGNLYLDRFDHWLKEDRKVRCYIRYMDDMLCFGTKSELVKLRNDSVEWLRDELKLIINHDGEINKVTKGVPFLGHVVFPSRIRLDERSEHRLRRKFRNIERIASEEDISEAELQVRGCSIFAAALYADSAQLRANLIKSSRFRDA